MRKHKLINDGATINITDNERISLTEENINLSDNFIWYDINPKSDTDINDLYKFIYGINKLILLQIKIFL